MESGAVISEDQVYRYRLWRRWDPKLPQAAIGMLNPSTADASKNDPTIRSCIRLTKELGFGGFDVINLMAFRATDPANLPKNPAEALGAFNVSNIEAVVAGAKTVICAWGAHPYAKRFQGAFLDICRLYHEKVFCFEKTKEGSPKHPLYIKSGTQLKEYP